jgi:hypothetical protein
MAAPNACKVGGLPSSCQLTVAGLPAAKLVVPTGDVICVGGQQGEFVNISTKRNSAHMLRTKTLAKAEADRVRTTIVENIVDQRLFLMGVYSRNECAVKRM